jgi:hypothetical protein
LLKRAHETMRATQEDDMAKRMMAALFLVTVTVGPAAFAQQEPQPGGIRSETQRRLAEGDRTYDALNWLGLIGLIGLIGLTREHPEDSYHPSGLE